MEKTKEVRLLLAVLATGVMSFAGVLIETAMNVTFPALIDQFDISTASVQWVTTIYLLMISIVVPLSTYLHKNYSLRNLFIFSNLTFLVGIIVDFLASSFAFLLVGRLLQGVATGIALPLMFHIILTYAPLEKRGTMMGLGTLTTSIAPAIGPTYGGILTSSLSWHYIFLFLIPILLLTLGLGIYAIPKQRVEKNGSVDLLSVLGLIIIFSSLLLFLSQLGQPICWFFLMVSLGGAWFFYRRTEKSSQPLIQLTVFKIPSFRLFLFSFLVYQFLLLGASFVLPNFIQIVKGQSAFVSGLAMLPGAVVGAVLSPISGKLLDRMGAKKPILLGLLFTTIGWTLLMSIVGISPISGLVAGHVFYMIGIGISYSNMMTTGMNAVPNELQGDANAVFNTLQQFSGAVATSLVAVVIGLAQRHSVSYEKGTVLGSQLAMGMLLLLLVISGIKCWRYFSEKAN